MNCRKQLYIHSILVHEKLKKLVKPVYLSERSNLYLVPKTEQEEQAKMTGSSEDLSAIKGTIKREFRDDPQRALEGMMKSYQDMINAEAEGTKDFDKSEASEHMATYVEEA